MGTMALQVQTALTRAPAGSVFGSETRYSVRPTLTHAHMVEEITEGRMSEMEHVRLWETHTAVFRGNNTQFSHVCNVQIVLV